RWNRASVLRSYGLGHCVLTRPRPSGFTAAAGDRAAAAPRPVSGRPTNAARAVHSESMMSKEPEEYEDIPGTWVFDAERARQGYHLNAFLYSLMKAENRAEFLADERKYLLKFPMTEAQREAVMKRDWNT